MILVDTSALYALLTDTDRRHAAALEYWSAAAEHDFVTHGYVVSEAIALTRARWGWPAVEALVDKILPRIRLGTVDVPMHDEALAAYRLERGGTSFIDRVTIAFARRHGISEAFAFDQDLVTAGLRFPGKEAM